MKIFAEFAVFLAVIVQGDSLKTFSSAKINQPQLPLTRLFNVVDSISNRAAFDGSAYGQSLLLSAAVVGSSFLAPVTSVAAVAAAYLPAALIAKTLK
jgi:hypothetical protein